MIRSSKHVISALIVMYLQLHPESSVSTPSGPVVGSAPGLVVGSIGVPGLVVVSAPEVVVGSGVPVSPSRDHCGKKGFVQDVI